MPGIFSRIRRSLSRLSGRCSCCRSSAVDVLPSIRRSVSPKAVESDASIVIERVKGYIQDSDSVDILHHYSAKPSAVHSNSSGPSSSTVIVSYSDVERIEFVPPNAVPDPEDENAFCSPATIAASVTAVPCTTKQAVCSIQQASSCATPTFRAQVQKSPELEFAAVHTESEADAEESDAEESEISDSESDDYSDPEPEAELKTELKKVTDKEDKPELVSIQVQKKLAKYRPLTHTELSQDRPLFHSVGFKNQFNISSMYIGTQCTVISLTAVVYHSLQPMAFWNYSALDYVVLTGNQHHHIFREALGISTNPDGRIALDEMPSTVALNFEGPVDYINQIVAYVGENSGVLLLHNAPDLDDMGRPSLRDYLIDKLTTVTEARFVITVGDFSHGLLKSKEGYLFLFDSHGFIKVNVPVFEYMGPKDTYGASLTQFEDLNSLLATLRANHSAPDTVCEARPVHIIPDL